MRCSSTFCRCLIGSLLKRLMELHLFHFLSVANVRSSPQTTRVCKETFVVKFWQNLHWRSSPIVNHGKNVSKIRAELRIYFCDRAQHCRSHACGELPDAPRVSARPRPSCRNVLLLCICIFNRNMIQVTDFKLCAVPHTNGEVSSSHGSGFFGRYCLLVCLT